MWARERRVWTRGGQVRRPCPHAAQDGARCARRVHILTAWRREGWRRTLGAPSDNTGVGPRGWIPAGPRPVQLRYETGLTGEQYVTAQAWRAASLERCPNHPHGGCSLARHATYARKTPRGTQSARWYCRDSHTTFRLRPDCLAARFPGELDTLEAVVAHAEQAPSLAAAANALRRDAVELPGAMRWVERRARLVHHVVSLVIGLLPEPLARCIAEVGAVRTRLETETALRALRTLVAEQLPVLPAPLGFHPHRLGTTNRNRAHPHNMGPDPPPSPA